MKNLTFLLFTCTVLLFASCFAAKDVKSDAQPISHEAFDKLLKKHVNEEGWVDYAGWKKDSVEFNKYLRLLSAHHPNKKHWTKDERLAYWINAYNAFTIELILKHYPLSSIKDIKDGTAFINSVWDISFINIEGEEYDLNNIEHNIIRKKFEEPRIHASIVCASRSCPKLRREAFTADKLEMQLQDQMTGFVTDPTRNNIISADRAELSKIFKWFSGDFTEDSSLIEFVNRFSDIKLNKDAEIDYLDYGWGINVQNWEEQKEELEKAGEKLRAKQ